jgi:hypothetical protein
MMCRICERKMSERKGEWKLIVSARTVAVMCMIHRERKTRRRGSVKLFLLNLVITKPL